MQKPTLVSGIQPTGKVHIGNYLGALKNFVSLQNTNECYFFIATYHSLTVGHDPKTKAALIRDIAEDMIAVGLDPKKCVIFNQVAVPECTELAWIFNTITPIAQLERMTQFKDKSTKNDTNVNMGLLDYPVLQAADILMYHGQAVPVGEDQIQHVEFTRKIARWFNNAFGEYFPEPEPIITPFARVMSIIDPTKKMSKSYGDAHCLYLSDDLATITAKLKKAPTGTGDEKETPEGVVNLLKLLDEFGKPSIAGEFTAAVENKTVKFSELKEALAEAIADYFAEYREKKKDLQANPKIVDAVLKEGAEKARAIAEKTMKEVREKVGI